MKHTVENEELYLYDEHVEGTMANILIVFDVEVDAGENAFSSDITSVMLDTGIKDAALIDITNASKENNHLQATMRRVVNKHIDSNWERYTTPVEPSDMSGCYGHEER